MTTNHDVKGSHIAHLRRLVDVGAGESAFDRIARELGVETHATYLPNVWYPLEPVLRVVEVAAPRLGSSVLELTERAATQNALEDVPTIFRIISRLMSPVRLLKATQNIWSQYVRFGSVVIVKNVPGHFIAEGHDIPARFGPWSIGAWRGFIPNAVTLAGGHEARFVALETSPAQGGLVRVRGELLYRAGVDSQTRGALV